ncbi:hypothetical protein ES707_08140 [subsurface metagenome]
MEGVVKWFSIKKSFGFIESQGKDYFVHRSDIEANSELENGDKVSFETEEAPKGVKAIKVRKIADQIQKDAHRGSYRPLAQSR